MMQKRIVFAVLAGVALLTAPASASKKDDAQKLIKTLLKDKDSEKRGDAAKSLGSMGADDAVPALAEALKDNSSYVRANATFALVELKDAARDAIPALKEVLDDRDSLVRLNACAALSNMDAATPAELATGLGPVLEETRGEDAKEHRENALKMLLEAGFEPAETRAVLLDALDNGLPDVRMGILNASWGDKKVPASAAWGKELTTHLIALLTSDRNPKIREHAIFCLRTLEPLPPTVGRAFLKALDDDDREVANSAAASMNIENSPLPPQAIAQLTHTLKTATEPELRANAVYALRGLIGYRERFIPTLLVALTRDQDPEVRAEVARSLGDLRADEAITPLLQALKTDSDPKVRAAACDGLKDLGTVSLARTNKLESALADLEAAARDTNGRVAGAARAAAASIRNR